MKSNYYGAVNRTALRKEMEKETNKRIEECAAEIQQQIQNSVSSQTMAVVFWILHREYGWGKARLNRLKDQLEDEFVLMHKGIMGVKYTPVDLREKLREQLGVDFDKSRYGGGVD